MFPEVGRGGVGDLFGLHNSVPNFGISLPSHHEKADYLFGAESLSVRVLIRP